MASLHELQVAFMRAVLDGDTDDIRPRVVDNGIPADTRVAIYANNALSNFQATLESTYPVIRRLGSDEWFRQTGTAYRRQYPSRSGNLYFVGQYFADFLARRYSGSPYAYFADVARLEWAYQNTLVAAESQPLDPVALSGLRPGAHEFLTFSLRPAVQLLRSDYPVLGIWRACQPEAEEDLQSVDLDSGPTHVLLIRRSDHVELREVDAADFALLDALASGAALGEAMERACAADDTFDLASALERCVRLGVLAGFRVGDVDPAVGDKRPGENPS